MLESGEGESRKGHFKEMVGGGSACWESSSVSWENKFHKHKAGKLHGKVKEGGRGNGLWWNHPIKRSPTKWASFRDEVLLVLPSVQPTFVMSFWRVRVPSVTCCRCSVLHSSLFTSRFTKQTWERGQKRPLSKKPSSSSWRKQGSAGGKWFEFYTFNIVDWICYLWASMPTSLPWS